MGKRKRETSATPLLCNSLGCELLDKGIAEVSLFLYIRFMYVAFCFEFFANKRLEFDGDACADAGFMMAVVWLEVVVVDVETDVGDDVFVDAELCFVEVSA